MVELLIGVLILVLIGGFALVLTQVRRQKPESNVEHLTFLNQNIHGLSERVDKTTTSMNERLDQATRVIAAVNKELGQVQEMGRSMQQLQDFLRSPKLRGNIGEQVLRDLLEQYFPRAHFGMQYKFRDGSTVDAVIHTEAGIIPIDSKFPMESMQRILAADNEEEATSFRREFSREVKKHINDISRKYILPSEGTVDFAVMYVPSESVYYEIICGDQDVIAYGQAQKVFLVSPNSFYFFLKILLMGMQGQKIEEASKHILEILSSIQKDSENFGEELSVLNRHLSNARGAMDRVHHEYTKLNSKIDQIKLLE